MREGRRLDAIINAASIEDNRVARQKNFPNSNNYCMKLVVQVI